MKNEDDPYAETGVNDAEEEELKKLMESDDLPPEDNQDGASTDAEPDGKPEADAGAEGDEPKGEPEGDEPARETAPADDEQFKDFLSKHKGKSTEELAKLAFQQQQRAKSASYDSRQAQSRLGDVLNRIEEARAAKQAELAQKREAFAQKVNDDPDAALKEARDAQLRDQQYAIDSEADRQAFEARAHEAVQLASAAIPNFQSEAPRIAEFAKEMGFSDQEIGGIADGRQIVTLHLARMAGNLVRSGVLGIDGTFKGMPQSVEEKDSSGGKSAQKRSQFSQQPARGSKTAKSFEQQLEDVANMTDADFAKLDENELDALLAQEGLQ